MRMPAIVLAVVVSAAPAPARSTEAAAYLAPRGGASVVGARSDEAPPDVGTTVEWRRGVRGTEETDGGDRSPQ